MGLREPPPAERSMLAKDALAGQIALVTGGGSGVGLAMALGLARCGASIAILSRKMDTLQKGLTELQATGATAIAVTGDVREPEQVAAAFDAVQKQLGPVSLLLNNAGANFPVLVENMSANAWRAIVRIALDGTLFCCKEFHQRRRALQLPGAIINNGATYAWTGFPGGAHSAAAKAGALNLTQTLATEWACDGIRVNSIVPGFYPHERAPDTDNRLGVSIPAGRDCRTQEIGWAAAYLCSPYANFVSGLNFVVDGTEWLRRSPLMPVFTPPRERQEIW